MVSSYWSVCGIGTITGGYIVQQFVKFQDFRAVVIGENTQAIIVCQIIPEY